MKKFISVILACLMTFNLTMPTFANDAAENMQNYNSFYGTPISTRAYPEKPSERKFEYNRFVISDNGRELTAAAVAAGLGVFLSSAGMLAPAILLTVGGVLIAGQPSTVMYLGEQITEYYICDFEGDIIGYKYYVTINRHTSGSKNAPVIETWEKELQSASPLSEEQLEIF